MRTTSTPKAGAPLVWDERLWEDAWERLLSHPERHRIAVQVWRGEAPADPFERPLGALLGIADLGRLASRRHPALIADDQLRPRRCRRGRRLLRHPPAPAQAPATLGRHPRRPIDVDGRIRLVASAVSRLWIVVLDDVA